jgi:hypothetical protein
MDRQAMDSLLVLSSIRTCYCKLLMSKHPAAEGAFEGAIVGRDVHSRVGEEEELEGVRAVVGAEVLVVASSPCPLCHRLNAAGRELRLLWLQRLQVGSATRRNCSYNSEEGCTETAEPWSAVCEQTKFEQRGLWEGAPGMGPTAAVRGRANERTSWHVESTSSTALRTASASSGWNSSATSDFVG